MNGPKPPIERQKLIEIEKKTNSFKTEHSNNRIVKFPIRLDKFIIRLVNSTIRILESQRGSSLNETEDSRIHHLTIRIYHPLNLIGGICSMSTKP